jgi:hypothetical protein
VTDKNGRETHNTIVLLFIASVSELGYNILSIWTTTKSWKLSKPEIDLMRALLPDMDSVSVGQSVSNKEKCILDASKKLAHFSDALISQLTSQDCSDMSISYGHMATLSLVARTKVAAAIEI